MTKDQIKQQINAVVDRWVNDTISSMTTGRPGVQPRGIWDRLKGTFYNLRYGRDDKKNNPYYWRNRFGDDLGSQAESCSPINLTLSEYNVLRSAVGATEQIINEVDSSETEKLRLVQVIRRAAEDLKSRLHSILDSWETSDDAPSPAPETSPSPKTAPISPEPGEEEPVAAGTAQTASTAQSAPEDNPAAEEPEPAAGTKLATKDASKPKDTKKTDIRKAIREAIAARKSAPATLTPQTSWLNRNGKIMLEKMPWVIAWISILPDTDYDDDSVEKKLKDPNRVGIKFKDSFTGLWKKEGHRSLISRFRQAVKYLSDNEFNKIISELTGGDVVDIKLPEKTTSAVAEKDEPKKKTRTRKSVATNPPKKEEDKESKQAVASQETQKEPADLADKEEDKESKSTDQEVQKEPAGSATAEEDPEEELKKSEAKKQDLLKTLYEGKNTKEIIATIQKKLIVPAWQKLGQDKSIGKKLKRFIERLTAQYDNDNEPLTAADGSPLVRQQDQDSKDGLIVTIKNGELLNKIVSVVGADKINESDLIGFLN